MNHQLYFLREVFFRKKPGLVLFVVFCLLAGLTSVNRVGYGDEMNNPHVLKLIEEAREIISSYGDEVWPGFGEDPPPVLLQAGGKSYLIGHPNPPSDYSQSEEEPNLFIKQGTVISKPAATSYPLRGEFTAVVPTAKDLEKFAAETGVEDFHVRDYEYVKMVIHESFHAYQMFLSGGPAGLPDFGFSGSPRDIQDDLSNSRDWKERVMKEGGLLLEAEDTSTLGKTRARIKDFTGRDGISALSDDSQSRKFEAMIELFEGTARYVGTIALMHATEAKDELSFECPRSGELKSSLFNQLSAVPSGPTPVRDRLAAIGAVKGFILDSLFPGWKGELFGGKKSLDELLTLAVNVPHPLKNFPITAVYLGEQKLTVALADLQWRKTHGMQEVRDIEPLAGMAFVFQRNVHNGFWMKDTEMPLQIGFFSRTGLLLESVVMDPCRTSNCPVYVPRDSYRYVLELPKDSPIQLSTHSSGLLSLQPGVSSN